MIMSGYQHTYNIVDRMYVGHIPETGTLALTGLGVPPAGYPGICFANFIVGGGAPLAAIYLGKKNPSPKDCRYRLYFISRQGLL